ncbi:hypothetical protein ASPZODRAFT_12532 [Penicilliopsis zonata CBS 506.65]|uniref:Uncharacterized protein n=1 Tax=Penicilliopsis zonata CBS 506.65 TaxID=1073090 RepID=A0A1L9SX32_9EURO|nr:hypothetical protein ASPZODRAFT_12532 [Penicilliopsis zonata CBS 506.65]OJJ51719.1 hypothetical protein ASPZODRAFT_12532 [Penicilliopsis zonata CBS 506.65]
MAAVRDSGFWRRFSLAVHMDEAKAADKETFLSDYWIDRQQQKTRRSYCCGCAIAFLISFFIAAAVIVIWWFASHNWLKQGTKG